MTDKKTFSVGDKVTYKPFSGPKEIGIVKSLHPTTDTLVFVVYRCSGNWEAYQRYTVACTAVSDLKHGWPEEI